MTTDEKVLWVKCGCYVTIGVCTPAAAAIAQWANSGQVPGALIWVGVALGSLIGGASQLLSFFSSSYGKHRQDQKEKEETILFAKGKTP